MRGSCLIRLQRDLTVTEDTDNLALSAKSRYYQVRSRHTPAKPSGIHSIPLWRLSACGTSSTPAITKA